jgi:hypothetical protein
MKEINTFRGLCMRDKDLLLFDIGALATTGPLN